MVVQRQVFPSGRRNYLEQYFDRHVKLGDSFFAVIDIAVLSSAERFAQHKIVNFLWFITLLYEVIWGLAHGLPMGDA